MEYLIQPVQGPVSAQILIPGSKSITNRALLLASFAEGVSELRDILLSDDTRVFIEALRALGVTITVNEEAHTCLVEGVGGLFPIKQAAIWCGDAGTAARFLLPACASTVGTYEFDGSPQLRNRPLEPLLRILCLQGAKTGGQLPLKLEKNIDSERLETGCRRNARDGVPGASSQCSSPALQRGLPVIMTGTEGLTGGEITMDGSQTGQFISGLLMVAPFAKSPLLLSAESLVSESYVDMTCKMMAEFGVLVKRMHQLRFSVPVPQHYQARQYVVEPDLSTASYFFAAAAVTAGRVSIQAFDREHAKQSDVKFIAVLEKMGCRVVEENGLLTVIGADELKGVNVDMRDFADTFMTLAAIAPFANSPTTITNIGHARLKESDRIAAMCAGFEKLNIKFESGQDWIKVYPSAPCGGVIDSFQDHRIAMAFSVVGLRVEGVVIQGAECVSKTCPEFFEMWLTCCS